MYTKLNPWHCGLTHDDDNQTYVFEVTDDNKYVAFKIHVNDLEPETVRRMLGSVVRAVTDLYDDNRVS